MGNFRSGNRGFDRGSRSSGGRFGGRSGFRERGEGNFGRPEMYDAVCSKCGKQCQVPFRPTGSKPVFCSDCFRQNGEGSGSRNNGPVDNSDQLNKINVKLDKILAILAELEIMPEEGEEDEIIVDSDDDEDSEDDSEDE